MIKGNYKEIISSISLLLLLISCQSNKNYLPAERNLSEFHFSSDSDYSAAIQRAINSKAEIIHVSKGLYKIGDFAGERGCLFSFYGDKPNHSNKTFLFEEGAILKFTGSLPNKRKFNENCNLFILENGKTRSLSNVKFENLTIDFTNNIYSKAKTINEQITGVKVVTSKFRNRKSFKRNTIVKNIEFVNTKFINGGSFTVYGGSDIVINGLEMINPKIGLSVSTDEHYGLYEPNMNIKNVRVLYSKSYVENLDPSISQNLYGFDFSEIPPKQTKSYTVDADSIYIQNATYCKVQGYGKLNLKNITIDGGLQGGQACFK